MGHILDVHGVFGAETRRESFYLYGPCFGGNRTEDGHVADNDGHRFHLEITYDNLPDLEVAIAMVRTHAERREVDPVEFPEPTMSRRQIVSCQIVEIDLADRAVELRLEDDEGEGGWRDPRVGIDSIPKFVWLVMYNSTRFRIEVNRAARTDLEAPLDIVWLEGQ
jgi:hypothetical protein